MSSQLYFRNLSSIFSSAECLQSRRGSRYPIELWIRVSFEPLLTSALRYLLQNQNQTKTVMASVPNDILMLIFQELQADYGSLLQCALVNSAFWRAASKFLYRRVVLAPRFSVVLSQRETPAIPVHLAFSSASRVSPQ